MLSPVTGEYIKSSTSILKVAKFVSCIRKLEGYFASDYALVWNKWPLMQASLNFVARAMEYKSWYMSLECWGWSSYIKKMMF